MTSSTRAILLGLTAFTAMVAPGVASAQEESTEEIVVTGTRVQGRTALDTVAPVDVISAAALTQAGTTELNQALSFALPSFNFPRPAITDGTDTVRPATLRGLAPDQTLVLLNSKRRHATALVNVNGSIGRGSSAVDLNAIPTAAIGSIEVLRDGASAQYGSDAIAGVMNVRLREASSGGGLTVTYGQRETSIETDPVAPPAGAGWTVSGERDASDGATTTVSGWQGLPLGENGFLTISAEYKDQEKTIRAAEDGRQQYPLVGSAFDPRELSFDRLNSWFGDPELEQYTIFANAGLDVGAVELYGWAGYQDRDSLSAGFFRRALDARNVLAIYPNGFLPKINGQVEDISAGFGGRFDVAGWDVDASIVYGDNTFDFGVRDSLNVSYGAASQTSFDAGGLEYTQTVGNISAVRGFDVGLASPLNVAVGVEAREETYNIRAGEVASYADGGLDPNGGSAPIGAQVFPGFTPANVVDEERLAGSAYIDLEVNLTDALLVSAAARVEDYSDFGSNLTGKVAARYDFNDAFAVRGAVSTGFRAPSLAQSYFTSTATNFISGVPFDILTVPASSATARTLGARDLDAEESTNYSVGFVARGGGLSFTADAYFIEVTDRIVLTDNLQQANVLALLPAGIGGIRFFQNGVDTETLGLDLVASYRWSSESMGDFNFTAGANFNNSVVTRTPTTNVLSSLSPPPVLFGRQRVGELEDGQPKEKFTFTTDWDRDSLGGTLRIAHYGSVRSPGTAAASDIFLGQKTLVDLEGRLSLGEHVDLALGAENLFDIYPDGTPSSLNGTGSTAFSSFSPFGFNGRYLYGRVALRW